eukprot:1186195-Prorocentrum_minimum.AAC.8
MAHMRRGVRVLLLDTHAQYTNGRRHGGWDLGNVGGLPEGITVRSEAHRGGSHLELAMIGPVLSAERPPTCPRKDAEMLTKAAKFQRLADFGDRSVWSVFDMCTSYLTYVHCQRSSNMDPQQLSQLEALCERLYNSQEPNERAHAEQVGYGHRNWRDRKNPKRRASVCFR